MQAPDVIHEDSHPPKCFGKHWRRSSRVKSLCQSVIKLEDGWEGSAKDWVNIVYHCTDTLSTTCIDNYLTTSHDFPTKYVGCTITGYSIFPLDDNQFHVGKVCFLKTITLIFFWRSWTYRSEVIQCSLILSVVRAQSWSSLLCSDILLVIVTVQLTPAGKLQETRFSLALLTVLLSCSTSCSTSCPLEVSLHWHT